MSILEQYAEFVDNVTSECSKNDAAFINRIKELEIEFANTGMPGQVSRLTTAAFGVAGEAGEFSEHIKKTLFHGKTMTYELKEKLISELSDLLWYAQNAAIALGVSLDDVIRVNIKKLEARYEGGKFTIAQSENRKIGDI